MLALYDALETRDAGANRPDYDGFMQGVTDELGDDPTFKEKMKRLGEEIADMKEFIMQKIQDDISIYNGKGLAA